MALTRREFILFGAAAGAIAGGGIAVPIGLIMMEDDVDGSRAVGLMYPRMRVASLEALSDGEPVMFDYPLEGQSNMLVKLGKESRLGVGPDGDVVAFSNLCTHMGCPITTFNAEHSVLGPCPCHFSTFDLARDGQVTLGQATQNLPQVVLEVDGDDVNAVGLLRLVYGYNDSLVGGTLVSA